MKKKTKREFAAMPGGVLNSETAKIAGNEITRIEEKYGAVKPQLLVKESKPPTAPLHSYFTWDNSLAAEKWREDEARHIIRSVRIIQPDIPHAEQPTIRCFVSVTASDTESRFEGHGYISAERAFDDEAYKAQVLASAKAEILHWQRKYSDLLTFANAEDSLKVLVEGLSR